MTPGEPTTPEQAAPTLLSGRDLIAETGVDVDPAATYSRAAIERVVNEGSAFGATALILTPTREEAIRVHESCFQISERGSAARIIGLFEGKPVTSQIGPLKNGVDIAVGTPGRVLEHVKLKTLRIEQLRLLVLDGFDQLFAGSPREVKALVRATPRTRQTVIFAEEIGDEALAFAHSNTKDPELIGVSDDRFGAVAPRQPARTVNLYFGAGKGAGVNPRDLTGVITGEGGLPGDEIGLITIKQNFSLVAVPESKATELLSRIRSSRVRGRKVKIRLERFQSKRRRS